MIRLLIFSLIGLTLTACVNRNTTNSPSLDNVRYASPAPEEGAMPGIPITNESLIKDALAEKFGTSVGNLDLTVTADEGIFAAGQVRILDTNLDVRWFAVREKGGWQIISAGQNKVRCSDLSAYPDFPAALIPECQTDQGQTVTR